MHQTSQIEGHLGKASRSGSLREQVCTSLRSEECLGSFQRDDRWVYNVQDHHGCMQSSAEPEVPAWRHRSPAAASTPAAPCPPRFSVTV